MDQHVFIQFDSVIPDSTSSFFSFFLSFIDLFLQNMLRMYSVLQLQQVWSNKPEEQDLTPATSPIQDVLPAVQEEETEDDNGV
ncbi:hypothetical protein L9G16_20095, partial [Shewanella sp. A25]|nr:hypothetical protein [Shewanella shenzhenensis]